MITRARKNRTAPLNVLVVEDDENDALLLKLALEDAGVNAHVDIVCDGKHAIEYLQLLSPFGGPGRWPVPELVIMDLKMPRLDGWQLLEWLRKKPGLKDIFVAVLSGSSCEADFDRAYACGADLCLTKPFGQDQLSAVVHRLTRECAMRSRAEPVAWHVNDQKRQGCCGASAHE